MNNLELEGNDMRGINEKKATEAKVRAQWLIKEKYGMVVENKKTELCPGCANEVNKFCRWNLLPITLSGEDCPYFEKKSWDDGIKNTGE